MQSVGNHERSVLFRFIRTRAWSINTIHPSHYIHIQAPIRHHQSEHADTVLLTLLPPSQLIIFHLDEFCCGVVIPTVCCLSRHSVLLGAIQSLSGPLLPSQSHSVHFTARLSKNMDADRKSAPTTLSGNNLLFCFIRFTCISTAPSLINYRSLRLNIPNRISVMAAFVPPTKPTPSHLIPFRFHPIPTHSVPFQPIPSHSNPFHPILSHSILERNSVIPTWSFHRYHQDSLTTDVSDNCSSQQSPPRILRILLWQNFRQFPLPSLFPRRSPSPAPRNPQKSSAIPRKNPSRILIISIGKRIPKALREKPYNLKYSRQNIFPILQQI